MGGGLEVGAEWEGKPPTLSLSRYFAARIKAVEEINKLRGSGLGDA